MASYLKPRRGTASNSSSIVLKSGEIFFEIGNSGTPTTGTGAKSFGKIKMGDGSTSYSSLGYFIDVDTTAVDWTDSTSTATSAAQGADNYTDLNAIAPTATLKSILGNIKSLLFNHSTQITTINTNLSASCVKVETATATWGANETWGEILLPGNIYSSRVLRVCANNNSESFFIIFKNGGTSRLQVIRLDTSGTSIVLKNTALSLSVIVYYR